TNFPNQFNWYQKIAKVYFVVTKLKLAAEDLAWFMAHSGNVASLDLWNLPIAPVVGPVVGPGPTFTDFEVMVNILKFGHFFPPVPQVTAATTKTVSVYSVLQDVIDGIPLATIEADLASLTGWDEAQLDQLINVPTNYLNLSLAAPSDLKDIRILLRLRQI